MEYCPFDIDPVVEKFDLESIFVDTSYGPLAVRVSRERSSRIATLYIHGVGADWTTWTPMLQAAAAARLQVHDQILIDLPGFGDSPNRVGRLPIADVGATVLNVVAELGYSKVRVVAHSMGGFLTLDMASRYPEKMESIHIVAGSYFSILETIQHPLKSFAHNAIVAATFGTLYRASQTGPVGVSAIRALYELGLFRLFLFPVASHPFHLRQSVVKSLSYQYNPAGVIQTAANGPGYDADRQWSLIRCPIWATFADRDCLVPPPDMARLLRCQPSAKCTMLTDSSHMMHLERPFDVLSALDLWAKES
jgi:pimeloyl-ACP methyl ester carboxylesterase